MIDPKFFQAVVGARIRYLRTLKRMDQCKLANVAGIDASKLSKIENGTHGIDSQVAVLVSDALNVSLDDLLEVPHDPDAKNKSEDTNASPL